MSSIEPNIQDIIKSYKKTNSCKETGREFNLSQSSILRRIKKYSPESLPEKNSISDEDISMFINLYKEGNSLKDISKKTGFSMSAIRIYVKGVCQMRYLKGHETIKKIILSEEDKRKIVSLYQEHWKYNKVSKIMGLHESKIRNFLIKNHPEIPRPAQLKFSVKRNINKDNNKYTVDETFFEKIDNQHKSYILGFLYADGYNEEKRGSIVIALHNKDIGVLEYINQQLQSNRPIIQYRDIYVRLIFSNIKLSNDLAKLGCIKNKSLVLKFPDSNIVPDELLHHFIRGYFDGDGTCYLPKRYKSTVVSFVGTEHFITNLNNVLSSKLNFTPYKVVKNKNVFTLSLSRKDVIDKFRDYLYNNAEFFFKRKFDKMIYYANSK